MSFTTIRYLYCDGPLCDEGNGEPFSVAPQINEPIEEQREQARSEGWTKRDGKDLCPECKLLPKDT